MDPWPSNLPNKRTQRPYLAVASTTSVEKQPSRTGSMSDSDRCVAANINSIIIMNTGTRTPKLVASVQATTVLTNAHPTLLNAQRATAIMP